MHDAIDTEYYLTCGHSVVAVEAIPELAECTRERLNRYIEIGQLTVLNLAIAASNGEATFWICDDQLVWSSLNKAIASRDNATHHSISVRAVKIDDLLVRFGIPHYLKVDIESMDYVVIEALETKPLPQYISVESECIGSDEVLTDEAALRNLMLLNRVGYDKFKLVNQNTLVPIHSSNISYALQQAHVQAFQKQLSENTDWNFKLGSSGPWGEQIAGPWMTFSEAEDIYCRLRQAYFSGQDCARYSFWFDWHATTSNTDSPRTRAERA
jgi:FkbM family methyltransferase